MYKYFFNALFNVKTVVLLLIGSLVFLSGCRNDQQAVNAPMTSNLREFSDSPFRLTWAQDLLDNKDVSAQGTHLALMGFDSEDGKGERVILAGPENFYRPLITSSGGSIVFSEFHQRKVQVVDWSGENRRDLTQGLALAVRRDPADGIEWVYVDRLADAGSQGPGAQRLYRVQLENPSIEELIWDKSPFGPAIHVSGDGRYLSAELPQSACGLIDTAGNEVRRYGKGCWPAVAPDLSYRFWFFDGAHRNLDMVDTAQGTRNRIHLADAPGIEGHEVYHPRWSNHPRYMVMTGPYTIRQGGNNIRGGGEGIEVYAGRFNKNFTDVEAWFRVTHNQRADFYPDLWIEKDENVDQNTVQQERNSSQAPAPAEGLNWPVVSEHLLFAWDNAAAKNEWTSSSGQLYQAEVVAEGRARFALNYQMTLGDGWFVGKRTPEVDLQEYGAVKAVSLEFVVTLPLQQKTDGRILSLGRENENQTVLQLDQGVLVLEERRKGKPVQVLRLGQLPVGQSHILLHFDPANITLGINSDDQITFPRKLSDIAAWPLTMGDARQQENSINKGLLERVALYSGALNEREVEQAVKLFQKMKKTASEIKPIVARAELLSASAIPLPDDIFPYRRGLVVNEYRIIELVQGEIKEPVILVAHWAILNGESLPSAERTKGKVYGLRLDAFDNRPELEGERLTMESENLLLPLYYDLDL